MINYPCTRGTETKGMGRRLIELRLRNTEAPIGTEKVGTCYPTSQDLSLLPQMTHPLGVSTLVHLRVADFASDD